MFQEKPFESGPRTPAIEVRTLGRYQILIGGTPLRFERRAPQRALQLLALLITRDRQTTGLGTIADLLWPEADGFDAQRALTTTLHRLRRLLGSCEAIRLVGGQMWIDPDICQIDAWLLERSVRSAVGPEALADALELYRGPFLGDDPSPWAISMRTRLERMVANGRDLLASHRGAADGWRTTLYRAWAAAG